MLDLKLIPLDDLIDELRDRFDSVIISGLRKNYESKDSENYTHRFKGSYTTNLGLCELMKDTLKDDFYETSVAIE